MPRPNHKKQRPHGARQTHIVDSDGWTHVVRGPSAVRLNVPGTPSSTTTDSSISQPSSTSPSKPKGPKVMAGYMLTPPPLASLADLEAEHAKQRRLLEDASVMRGLRRELRAGLADNPHTRVVNAVCIGLGSLCTSRRTISMRQLVAFEMLLETLQGMGRVGETDARIGTAGSTAEKRGTKNTEDGHSMPPPLDLYLQELAFTPLDIEFLTGRGYKIVDVSVDEAKKLQTASIESNKTFLGPIGQHLTEGTFLYAPHLEISVIRMATEIAAPALYLGNDMCRLDITFENAPSLASIQSSFQIDGAQNPTTKMPYAAIEGRKSEEEGYNKETGAKVDQTLRRGGMARRWLREADWRSPAETRRFVQHDDNNWSSHFAFAFRRTADNEDKEMSTSVGEDAGSRSKDSEKDVKISMKTSSANSDHI